MIVEVILRKQPRFITGASVVFSGLNLTLLIAFLLLR